MCACVACIRRYVCRVCVRVRVSVRDSVCVRVVCTNILYVYVPNVCIRVCASACQRVCTYM